MRGPGVRRRLARRRQRLQHMRCDFGESSRARSTQDRDLSADHVRKDGREKTWRTRDYNDIELKDEDEKEKQDVTDLRGKD